MFKYVCANNNVKPFISKKVTKIVNFQIGNMNFSAINSCFFGAIRVDLYSDHIATKLPMKNF